MIKNLLNSLSVLTLNDIVHGDLKSENILLKFTEENILDTMEVKIIDFGNSKFFSEAKGNFDVSSPEYLPP